jgi:DNA cross-link repair 1A protein
MFRNPREKITNFTANASAGKLPTPPRGTPLGSRSNNVKKVVGEKARNGSILSFFKKVDHQAVRKDDGEGLFFKDDNATGGDNFTPEHAPFDYLFEDPKLSGRYNEDVGPIKRRRLGSEAGTDKMQGEGLFIPPVKGEQSTTGYPRVACSPPPLPDYSEWGVMKEGSGSGSLESVDRVTKAKKPIRVVGPFVEDSGSEEETEGVIETMRDSAKFGDALEKSDPEAIGSGTIIEAFQEKIGKAETQLSSLNQDEMAVSEDEEFGDTDMIEDYDDDEFLGGEEMAEGRWMEEERRLEMAEDGADLDFIDDFPEGDNKALGLVAIGGEMVTVCPICSVSLEGITDAVSFGANNVVFDVRIDL